MISRKWVTPQFELKEIDEEQTHRKPEGIEGVLSYTGERWQLLPLVRATETFDEAIFAPAEWDTEAFEEAMTKATQKFLEGSDEDSDVDWLEI